MVVSILSIIMKSKLIAITLSAILITACSSSSQTNPTNDPQPASDSNSTQQQDAPQEDTSNGQSSDSTAKYTMADVQANNSESSCYTAINGNIYDLTSFIASHPGGARNIMKLCGIDGTSIYMSQHGDQPQPEAQLSSLYIGELAQ
jgi:cytochrome b involved in lipid metabolism